MRDRVLFAFMVSLLILNIISAAGEVGTELNRAALGVHDADRTAASRERERGAIEQLLAPSPGRLGRGAPSLFSW